MTGADRRRLLQTSSERRRSLFVVVMVQGPSMVIGVDLVRVADVARSLERYGARYVRRIFTEREIEYCSREPHLAGERYAARFAAKEATTKILHVTTDAMIWRSIEVRRHPGGWCDIVLHDQTEALAKEQGITGFALSMSHEHDYAMATVVAHKAPESFA